MLSKARHYAPTELKSLYHALFSSHLNYGSQIWGQSNNSSVNQIFILQKAALRIITFSNFRAHTNPLFKENNILKLNDRITLENCLFVYDCLKGKLPICFNNYFQTLTEAYRSNVRTRSSKSGYLYIPAVKSKKYGLNSMKRNSIDSWNKFSKLLLDTNSIVDTNNNTTLLQMPRSTDTTTNQDETWYAHAFQ